MKTQPHTEPDGPVAVKKRRRRNERNAAMYDDDVFDLLHAIDEWRRKSRRSFPAWSEVIQIMKGLGWSKPAAVAPKSEPVRPKAEAIVPKAEAIEPMEPVHPS